MLEQGRGVRQSTLTATLFILLCVAVLFLILKGVFAWTNPTQAPPGGSGSGFTHPYLRLIYTDGTLPRNSIIPFVVSESGNGASWANNKFTAPKAGVYLITVSGRANGTVYLYFEIHKNGSIINTSYGAIPDANKPGGATASTATYMNAGDYIDFLYNHDSAGPFLLNAHASIVYIGS